MGVAAINIGAIAASYSLGKRCSQTTKLSNAMETVSAPNDRSALVSVR